MINIPYKRKTGSFEKAKRIGHVPIVENEFVKTELNSFHISHQEKINKIPEELMFDLKDEINNS